MSHSKNAIEKEFYNRAYSFNLGALLKNNIVQNNQNNDGRNNGAAMAGPQASSAFQPIASGSKNQCNTNKSSDERKMSHSKNAIEKEF